MKITKNGGGSVFFPFILDFCQFPVEVNYNSNELLCENTLFFK